MLANMLIITGLKTDMFLTIINADFRHKHFYICKKQCREGYLKYTVKETQ